MSTGGTGSSTDTRGAEPDDGDMGIYARGGGCDEDGEPGDSHRGELDFDVKAEPDDDWDRDGLDYDTAVQQHIASADVWDGEFDKEDHADAVADYAHTCLQGGRDASQDGSPAVVPFSSGAKKARRSPLDNMKGSARAFFDCAAAPWRSGNADQSDCTADGEWMWSSRAAAWQWVNY